MRTEFDIQRVREAIYDVAKQHQPLSIRAVFYRLLSHYPGLIAKTEVEYQRTVVRLCGEMREAGTLPFEWLVDSGRDPHLWPSFTGIEDAVASLATWYERDVWRQMPVQVEVWTEKEAMFGTISAVCQDLQVPLRVIRGFASKSSIMQAATYMYETDKPVHVIYVGDHDPSGLLIETIAEETLRRYLSRLGFSHPLTISRACVTPNQITAFKLPTRATKASNHSGTFVGDSVEVDALAPSDVRAILRAAIDAFIDPKLYAAERAQEADDRETLVALSSMDLPGLV